MRTETRKRVITYKRVVLTGKHEPLQHLLVSALAAPASTAKAAARREPVTEDGSVVRLINRTKVYAGMFFGQFVIFERGRGQPLIETEDDGAEAYPIATITTDAIGEQEQRQRQREFIESVLYFGAFDNHLLVVQSQALKARDLEAHLSWLLQTRTDKLDRGTALILQDKPPESTIEKVRASSVKSIVIGSPVTTCVVQEPAETRPQPGEARETQSAAVRFMPVGAGADLLRAVMGENWFERINLTDALDEANIRVRLEVTYLKRTTTEGQRVLDTLAASMRHVDDSDVEVVLARGGSIKGDELRLRGTVSVKAINGAVDEDDLYHQMHDWLVTMVAREEIDTPATGKDKDKK